MLRLQWLRLLGSRAQAQQLWLLGLVGLKWDLPRGIEPESPALAGRFFTTEPPGKSHSFLLDVYSSSIKSKVIALRKKRESGKSKGKMGLGNLQNFLGRMFLFIYFWFFFFFFLGGMFLKCRFRMGTWTVCGFQHEHLATPTLVSTADWLSLALAHLPGMAKHRKADKLPASFTFSFYSSYLSASHTWMMAENGSFSYTQ